MNRAGVFKHLAVIIAFSEGAEVEYRTRVGMQWRRTPHPAFAEDHEYRVKTKPQIFTVVWDGKMPVYGKARQLREYEKRNAKNAGYTVEEYTRPCAD